jgi:ribosome-associated toxin RatA of RatAB toxin-antitoxin module
MKEVTGRGRVRVEQPLEDCFALLEAVEGYPRWIGEYVREVGVLERDARGRPRRAVATVHVEQSPFGKDFELVLAVAPRFPRTIGLRRMAHDDRLELVWQFEPSSEGTTISLEFVACISFLPSLLPVGDAGDAIAESALAAVVEALSESTDGLTRQRT